MLTVSSCITRKQYSYLQGTDEELTVNNMLKKDDPYKVQVNDILKINIKTLNQELVAIFNATPGALGNVAGSNYPVNRHGNIRMPILGDVNVLGYTTEEIRMEVEQRLLAEYLTPNSQLYVRVSLAGLRFTVLGEVNNPGTKSIDQEKVNILEAMAAASEIPITGDKRDVRIFRQYPDGKRKVHRIDLTQITALDSEYFYIQPNDIIVVDALPQKLIGTGTTGLQTFTTIFSVVSVITSTVLLIRNLN
ncbi:polysaccharide biosynthesis/export family protein [Sungkyunkwania multivorans]|uniref:Polysaccharide biosynthesis/export family protein n=1 Tax=Sungkyunkwania multivorans TaxID=1173618 RepID=A0ABW3D445_9FLAO